MNKQWVFHQKHDFPGKQKIADYFNKFTKKIDEKLDQIDQQFEKSNDKYYDIDALSKMDMYEAKYIDKDKRKKSSFWSNLMQGNSTNYLGITLDGKVCSPVVRNY